MITQQYFYGTGRRKTAVARVRLYPGSGTVIVNGKPFEEIFTRPLHQAPVARPREYVLADHDALGAAVVIVLMEHVLPALAVELQGPLVVQFASLPDDESSAVLV